MSITTVIIISLLLADLSLTLIMFWVIHDLLSAVKSLQDTEDILKHALDLCNDQIKTHNTAMERVYAGYDAIRQAYEAMRKQYDSIVNMNTKLLECWKGCEERYSQSYELFKHCSDNLKEVSFQLTDLANISTEDEYTLTLNEACDTICCDCHYDECIKETCPVWKLKYKDSEFLNSLTDLVEEKGDKERTDDDR